MNPTLVLQGDLSELPLHLGTALLGITIVCGGLQGYLPGVGDLRRSGAFEWLIRAVLVLGGLLFVAPGGGLMPLSSLQMTAAAVAVTVPALLLALLLRRRGRAG